MLFTRFGTKTQVFRELLALVSKRPNHYLLSNSHQIINGIWSTELYARETILKNYEKQALFWRQPPKICFNFFLYSSGEFDTVVSYLCQNIGLT